MSISGWDCSLRVTESAETSAAASWIGEGTVSEGDSVQGARSATLASDVTVTAYGDTVAAIDGMAESTCYILDLSTQQASRLEAEASRRGVL